LPQPHESDKRKGKLPTITEAKVLSNIDNITDAVNRKFKNNFGLLAAVLVTAGMLAATGVSANAQSCCCDDMQMSSSQSHGETADSSSDCCPSMSDMTGQCQCHIETDNSPVSRHATPQTTTQLALSPPAYPLPTDRHLETVEVDRGPPRIEQIPPDVPLYLSNQVFII
jgi:hypothetical protein